MARPRFVRRSVGRQSTPKLFDFSPIERRSSLDRLQVAPISKRERWLIDYKFAVPLFRFLELFLSTSIERRDGPAFRAGSEFDGRFDVHRPRSSGRSARPSYRSFLIDGRSRPIEVGRGRSRPIEADRGRSRPIEAGRGQSPPGRADFGGSKTGRSTLPTDPRSVSSMFCRSTSIEHLDRSGFRDRGSFGGRSSIAIDQFSRARGSVEGRLAVNQPRSSANFPKRGPSEARARPDQGPIVSRSCQFRSTNAGRPTAILRSAVRFFDSFFSDPDRAPRWTRLSRSRQVRWDQCDPIPDFA